MKNCKYAESAFKTDFFKYDVSKYRTETAVPFYEQDLWWHFSDYKNPKFEDIDELDAIFRCLGEIDAEFAYEFAKKVNAELEDLFFDFEIELRRLVERVTFQYGSDEEYVSDRLREIKHHSRKTQAAE